MTFGTCRSGSRSLEYSDQNWGTGTYTHCWSPHVVPSGPATILQAGSSPRSAASTSLRPMVGLFFPFRRYIRADTVEHRLSAIALSSTCLVGNSINHRADHDLPCLHRP